MAKKNPKAPKKITKAKIKSMQRTAKRKSLAQWSKDVRDRDGNKCVVCGKTEYIQSHHLIPKERFKQFMFEIDNGIALCPSCHKYGSYSFHRNPLWACDWLQKNRPQLYQAALWRVNADIASHQDARQNS